MMGGEPTAAAILIPIHSYHVCKITFKAPSKNDTAVHSRTRLERVNSRVPRRSVAAVQLRGRGEANVTQKLLCGWARPVKSRDEKAEFL